MSNITPSKVRLGASPRCVLTRPGVGAAGHIVQRSDLTSHRIVITEATLILVEEGRKRILWPGGACVAQPGEVLSLHAGEVVDISNTPGRRGTYRALWICWTPELLVESSSDAGRRSSPRVALHTALSEAFRAAYYRAFDSLDESTGLPASVARHQLLEVLIWLRERGFHFPPPVAASLAQRVRGLISVDPAADWSMQKVAHETAMSISTLRRKLAAEGIIFRELMQDVRMSHALAQLQNTDAPVLEVARATGYDSASRFAARFRARFGYLPSDIRGQNR